jgi:DNA-binding PadR family transcriptional regulator
MKYDVEGLLPLSPNTYHVLLALGDEVMHGYAIIESYEMLTGGRETLLPGSLYATLARMAEMHFVEEAAAPTSVSGGPERRYYRMTAVGRAAARAESLRRLRLLEAARVRGLAPRGGAL